MNAVRDSWTDERLDDLANRMDRGFDRVDADLRELRTEMNARFGLADARFDSMQRMMVATLVSVVVGFVSVLGAVLATNL